MKDSPNREYTTEWLQTERPQPMFDESINKFYENFYNGENPVHNEYLFEEFKIELVKWLGDHKLNNYSGYEKFEFKDICVGCTQFIQYSGACCNERDRNSHRRN